MRFSELCQNLKSSGIENAAFEAYVIAEEYCNVKPSHLMVFPDTELTGIDEVLCRRCNGEPLQYILGKWEFFGLTFKVREGCLIPRSDTEILTELAIKSIPIDNVFADLCSGSGCIGISVLSKRSDLRCISYDKYEVPVELTYENAVTNCVSSRLTAKKADILASFSLPEEVRFIVSNPPYIRTEIIPTLGKTVLYEPKSALDGGKDGLDFYHAILKICMERKIPALLEIGYDQGRDICSLANEYNLRCVLHKDYSGNDRVAEIEIGDCNEKY